MENYEELLIVLEEFERSKPKEIPKELDDFIGVVAKTGNIMYPWVKIKAVYRSKIMSVLSQFFETFPTADISQFSFESMKTKILERFDQFISAPFTIQRLSELLINPRKEYNRIDKYMRAIEKNILVVSGVEPGCLRQMHLNGGVEIIEGFQVSSTPVNEESREMVEEENDVATDSISKHGQEVHKVEECSENKEEELKLEDSENEPSEGIAGEVIDCNGNTSTQEKITTNEESIVDLQENHLMEFSSAETEAQAIAENVSEEICLPDVSNSVEESGKEYSHEGTSMNGTVPEDNVVSDGPVISGVESCDTMAEVEAIAQSVPVEDDMSAPTDKSIETDEKVEEDMNMDTSPPKEESLLNDSIAETKADNQNVNVIDVGSSMEVHSKTGSDSEVPTKVLILSSPSERQFQGSINCSVMSESEGTEKGKEELSNIEPDEISSASEKLVGRESDDCQKVKSESNETSEDSTVEQTATLEHEPPLEATSPGESSSCSQESPTSQKIESS